MEPDARTTGARRPGRPRLVDPTAIEEIVRLRAERYSWKEIAARLSLKQETARRALWAVKKARRAVGNPPATVNNPLPEG